MRLSRDEAREVALYALLLTIVLRLSAGIFQVLDEVERGWTWKSVLGRFLAPVGSTMGILSLAAAMVIVMAPKGALSMRVVTPTAIICGVVSLLGAASVLNGLVLGGGHFYGRLWFALINGCAAAVLAGAAWWILTNFDEDR